MDRLISLDKSPYINQIDEGEDGFIKKWQEFLDKKKDVTTSKHIHTEAVGIVD